MMFVFLPASALRTAVNEIGWGSLGQGPRTKQYLFNFHVFIYTVADACWLPAHRLPSLDFWLGLITILHFIYYVFSCLCYITIFQILFELGP